MTQEDITFIKTLLIKLDLSIDAQRGLVNGKGLMLLMDFTEPERKADVAKALDILSEGTNE